MSVEDMSTSECVGLYECRAVLVRGSMRMVCLSVGAVWVCVWAFEYGDVWVWGVWVGSDWVCMSKFEGLLSVGGMCGGVCVGEGVHWVCSLRAV